MKKLNLLFALLFASASLFAQTNYSKMQDVVYLKNGSVIRGYITEQVPNQSLKIETPNGSKIILDINEIERISKEKINSKNEKAPNPRLFKVKEGLFFSLQGSLEPPSAFSIHAAIVSQHNNFISSALVSGIDYDIDYKQLDLPIYLDNRVYILRRKVTPYIYNKLGSSYAIKYTPSRGGATGVYFGMGLGLRVNYSANKALLIDLGYKRNSTTTQTDYFAINFGFQF